MAKLTAPQFGRMFATPEQKQQNRRVNGSFIKGYSDYSTRAGLKIAHCPTKEEALREIGDICALCKRPIDSPCEKCRHLKRDET